MNDKDKKGGIPRQMLGGGPNPGAFLNRDGSFVAGNMPHTVMKVPHTQKLTVVELAEAIYEGTQHVQNLAEKLARQHGKAGALTFFNMMGDDIRNFYMHIAQQLIDHAKCWQGNEGSSCILDDQEAKRLRELPRHPELVPRDL